MSVVIITLRDNGDNFVSIDIDGDAVDTAAKTPAQRLADAAIKGTLEAPFTVSGVRKNHRVEL